jgi:hypothetical protein
MRGVITGGWSYVVAAYSITTLILAVYAVSLLSRLRQERR